jgi:phosphatidylinositol N-acetylglucosaminyltransferase subunit C
MKGSSEKVLSYTDSTANFKPYTYWPLVIASCAITQHLATIYIFLAVFVRLQEYTLDPRILVWITVACFVGGYMTWELLDCSYSNRVQRNTNRLTYFNTSGILLTDCCRIGTKTLKSSILVFLALMALSPVLKTLSAATSSDSIWALSACLFTLNALLADYSPTKLGSQVRER